MGRLEEKERGIFSTIFGWLVYILILIGFTYLIITYVGQRTRVSGHSMETTLSDGDNLIVISRVIVLKIRNGMILLYFLINMKKILIILSGLSVCRGKLCR